MHCLENHRFLSRFCKKNIRKCTEICIEKLRFLHEFSKKTKINIPMPSLDGKKSRKSVEDNRGHVLDAAIVRIMKTRNIMDHSELVAEVFKQVHIFEPKTKAIKKQIESLINREYLERGEGSTKTYKYLA